MKSVLPLSLVLALAACGGKSAVWVKEDAGEAQVRADQAACRAQVERALGRTESFTRDIRGSTRGGLEETRTIVSASRDRKVARSLNQMFGRCMAARGYVRPET
ncbi:MAG: hypothetical protein CMM26_05950 [Rhodospirillaceae bacterium]|mgnify:CR=1 FL=1|nr:hypothetical protein [Rhodospirillaceae bacterium]